MTLTPRRHEILAFIAERLREGEPPSLREIGRHFGITSTNGVRDHMLYLGNKGVLEPQSHGRSRALRLTPAGWQLLGYSECRHCGGRVGPGRNGRVT